MRVLVTRPAEDGEQTALQLAALGHQPLLAPLLATHFFDMPAPALDDVQAILATSANGVRALVRCFRSASPAREALAGEMAVAGPRASESQRGLYEIPLFAVGPQTADAAAAAGFGDVRNADGDARALAEAATRWAAPAGGALLHVSGEQGAGILAETLTAHGFVLRKAVLYRVDAAERLPASAAAALAGGEIDAALFFSPRSARVFARLAARDKLPVRDVIAICISAATAQALTDENGPAPFATIRVAAVPNQAALLACLAV